MELVKIVRIVLLRIMVEIVILIIWMMDHSLDARQQAHGKELASHLFKFPSPTWNIPKFGVHFFLWGGEGACPHKKVLGSTLGSPYARNLQHNAIHLLTNLNGLNSLLGRTLECAYIREACMCVLGSTDMDLRWKPHPHPKPSCPKS